jgi:hypothetical protein
LAATTLRNTLGMHTLQEILQDKEKLAQAMQESLDNATHTWCVKFFVLNNIWNIINLLRLTVLGQRLIFLIYIKGASKLNESS